MATHFSILAWRIPWTVQSMGLQRVDTTERLSLSLHCFPSRDHPALLPCNGSRKQQVSHARSAYSGCLGWGHKLSTTSRGVSATGVPVHFDLCWLQTSEDGRPGRAPPPFPEPVLVSLPVADRRRWPCLWMLAHV